MVRLTQGRILLRYYLKQVMLYPWVSTDMISLEIGNSVCAVKGVTQPQLTELRDVCAYYVSSGRSVPRKGKDGKTRWIKEKQKRHLMSQKGLFPTGLLYIVEKFIFDKAWDVKRVDTRKRPAIRYLSDKSLYISRKYEPREEQLAAAMSALAQERGIIVGPTGVGKSAICELICDTLRVKTLIVVPSLPLKKQLTETLREAFGRDMVGPLGKNCVPQVPISVENVDALSPNRKLSGVDCVIIDEFHHSAAATYRALNLKSWCDVYFKIGLTATPFRANDEERLLLESVLSKVIYRIEYNTAVEKKYIVPLEAYYIDMPKDSKVRDISNFASAYTHYVVKNDNRNKIIADMVSNLIDAGQSTLVLTKQIAHGNELKELLRARGHDVPFAEGSSETKSEDIEAFNSKASIAAIGTVGVMGEGMDTRPAEWVFLAGGGKSKNQFMQNVGRVFRNYPGKVSGKVVMIRDQNNKWLLEHFNKCVKYLREEYGVIATKLDLGT